MTAVRRASPPNATVTIDLDAIDERICQLVKIVKSEIVEDQRACSNDRWNKDTCSAFGELIAVADTMEGEEKLFYVFLATHFDSAISGHELHCILNWQQLVRASAADLHRIITGFLQGKPFIGDHRRHFRCLKTPEEKIRFTVEVLESYKAVAADHGSQSRFFETDGHPEFGMLYERMRTIRHFERRLPRFDHLERLARTHGFYIMPERFYAEDDTGGPRDGLTYLLFGQRLRGNKALMRHLVAGFPREWNDEIRGKYRIIDGADLRQVLTAIEAWVIDEVRRRLPVEHRTAPSFIFDLESCLCNWQKGK